MVDTETNFDSQLIREPLLAQGGYYARLFARHTGSGMPETLGAIADDEGGAQEQDWAPSAATQCDPAANDTGGEAPAVRRIEERAA